MSSWAGSNWNQVFVGSTGAPSNSFPNPPYTTIAATPKVAEKPYLYVDDNGSYRVFVPAVRTGTTGTTWANGDPAGMSLPISQFHVVRPGDTAASMNAALAAGQNLRVGGAIAGKAEVSMEINSDDVIGDHAWIWRADHGNNGTVGWTVNTGRNGLIVNGDDATMYGLFVEHYQQYQTIWNGERGRTYFYQNEMPYDPPNQAAYMNGSTEGWAAYKVGDAVTDHQAWGLGSYAFFNVNPSVANARAFEVPVRSGVRFHNMVTVSLGGVGTIRRVINNTGETVNSGRQVTHLTTGP
jgi:hypothetical protein